MPVMDTFEVATSTFHQIAADVPVQIENTPVRAQ
jgi:hypothetical protein